VSPRLARLPIGDAVHDRQPLGWPAAQRGRPNVLYIVWDDATIAAWEAFGGLIGTPNMDWLARRGLRYSQWHTTALSSRTRSCLLTGRECDASGRAATVATGHRRRAGSATIPAGMSTLEVAELSSLWRAAADCAVSLAHDEQEVPELPARSRPQLPDRRAS